MRTRTCKSRLKPVALLGAAALGLTAFGDYYEWTSAEKGYWEDDTSWTVNTADFTDYRAGNTGSEIAFKTPATADDTYGVVIYNNTYSFSADDAAYGLTKENAGMYVSTWWNNGAVTLNVASGTYEFSEVAVNEAGAAYSDTSAALNLNGGTLSAGAVRVATGGTLTMNGGTLATTSVTGAGTLAIGANGGTFANTDSATISTALTGSGTLTKTGAGDLTISGDVSGFTGKIVVAAEAGYVVIAGVTVNAGEEFQVGAYYWTGAGTKTTTVDPDSGDEVQTVANTDVWANLDNWLVNGAVPTVLPTATSTVIIPAGDGSALTIKISDANEYTGYLTINRDVKFARTSSDRNYNNSIYLTQVSGSGTLTLEAGGGYSSNDRQGDRIHLTPAGDSLPFQIDTDLVVNGRIRVMRNGNVVPTLTLNGALKGTGYLYFNNYHNGEGARLNGDTSEFAGVFEGGGANGFARDATKFSGDARGSELASWKFGRWDQNADATYGFTPFLVNNVTYKFGQLTAPLMHFWRGFTGSNTTGATIEVGALAGKTSTVTGSLSPSGNTLRKVGATSTLKYTNSGTAGGTVEAYEGTTVIEGTATGFTLKFSGTDATIKIARSTTTETDSGEEDDESTIDVDESKTVTTTTNIPSTFVPGFTDALVGCQYEVTQETVDNVTYDVYTVLTDVATDSAGTVYDSVALALAAIAADETLTKVVTLAKSTTEAVTLPLGYSLALDGNTVGSVAGASGVGVAYDEATDTWTTVDNTAATWQGDAAGANWADAANWSTGYVPDESTAVTFNYSAVVYLSEYTGPTHKCATIKLKNGITVEFAPTERNQNLYPRIAIYGETVWGDATLKLYRCGLYNAHGSTITVYPALTFENQGGIYDSYVENGAFKFARGVSGTGTFICYQACTFNAGITVEDDSVVDCRATPTFAQGATLVGDGTLVCTGSMPGTRLVEALQNGEKWTGTFKLVNTTHKSVTWLGNLGNANSTVSFDNVTTYLYTSAGTGGSHGVGTMDIAAGGLKINGSYSSGNFVFPAKLTGTGTFTVGIAGNNNKNVQFTGDCSEFAGTIAWASDTANTRVVIGDDTTSDFTAGTVVVNAGKTLGAATVNGTLEGAGAVAFTSIAPTTPTYGESWTGSIVLPVTNISAKTSLALPTLSTANGTIVVKGITRATNQNSLYLGTGESCTVAGTTQLDGELNITDGNSNTTYTWNKITGTGNALFTAEGGSAAGITHAITTLSDYSGTITVGKNVTLTIGTINLTSAPSAGDRLVKTAVSGNGVISAANAKVAVNGEEITEPETLLLKSDGIYYGTATSTAYDGGDGSTFSIDSAVAAVMTTYLPEGATLASTVEGKTFTYAQAYALGLVSVENDALVVDDLTATIAVVDGKVVVSLGSTPEAAYTITCNVYENTSLTDTWSETPAHTYVVGSETEAAGFTPESDAAGFYKVGVTIGNKATTSQE